QLGTEGSSKGTGRIPGVLDESTVVSATSKQEIEYSEEDQSEEGKVDWIDFEEDDENKDDTCVPLNTLGDIDNLTKAIDLGKLKVWSDLPSEKHSGKSDVGIGESLTSVEGVAAFFGVPLKMQVDYENFAKGIERGTYEVWLKLTHLQCKAILKTADDGWNALLELEPVGLGAPMITMPSVVSPCEPIVKTIDTDENSDPIVQSVDINTMPTSYAGVAGANNKDQPKGRSSFAWCLIEVNSKADLVEVVTIGGKPPIVATPNVVNTSTVVNPTVDNDSFQAVGKKKKKKGKPNTSNSGQFVGPLIHQNLRYKPKASTSAPMKVANMGNASISLSLLKNKVTSSHQYNITSSNSFSALNVKDEEEEEEVEYVYDGTTNLINTKTGKRSSFTAAVG
nr:hypothetical protein [Tanacetum cinerariifolium]GEZ03980.1 hypothetical protein [Tanacetum cinerariifolium]